MITTTRKKQLAGRIRNRREELGLRQDGVQEHGGPSPETVNQYEQGNIPDKPQNRTLHSFDKALRWQTGSIRRFLEKGEEPIPLEGEGRVLAYVEEVPAHVPSGTVRLPRRPLDDVIRASSKLALIARITDCKDPELLASIAQVQQAASDLSTLLAGLDAQDPEIISLIARISGD